ncbi:hypothetical protein G6F40_017844 [Rhizopus arrhizus]|nr:hypothetical protein G6F40_017844 [Rhizopus arrhizus]
MNSPEQATTTSRPTSTAQASSPVVNTVRPRRPSRAYIQIDSASSGRVNHHRPIAAGILPVAIQPLPMNIRLVPTM